MTRAIGRFLVAAVAAASAAVVVGQAGLTVPGLPRPPQRTAQCKLPPSLSFGGRPVAIHLPPNGREAMPLVINLHGWGRDAADQEQISRFDDIADRLGLLVAYPEATQPAAWNSGGNRFFSAADDTGRLRSLVSTLVHAGCADPRRVYATGFSNGGAMSARLACDASNTVTAVAVVAGVHFQGDACHPAQPVSVMAIQGAADPVTPLEGGPFNNAGPPTQPIEAWAEEWARRNSCRRGPDLSPGAAFYVKRWTDCAAGTEVVLYVVRNSGHIWPGAAFGTPGLEASAIIGEFFAAHELDRVESTGP